MGQSWYGEPLVPDGAKRAVSGTSCNLQQTQARLAAPKKIKNPAAKVQTTPAKTGRSRFGCLGPFDNNRQGEHSCACLIEPGDSILLRQGVADCTGLSDECEGGAHGIPGICLGIGMAGMAGAHWSVLLVLLQLQPAGAVGGGRWGGYGKERSFQVPRALH